MIRAFLIGLLMAASAHAQVVVPYIQPKVWTPGSEGAAAKVWLETGNYNDTTGEWSNSGSWDNYFKQQSGTICGEATNGAFSGPDLVLGCRNLTTTSTGTDSSVTLPSSYIFAMGYEPYDTTSYQTLFANNSLTEHRVDMENGRIASCDDGPTRITGSIAATVDALNWIVCVFDTSGEVYQNTLTVENTGDLSTAASSAVLSIGQWKDLAIEVSKEMAIYEVILIDISGYSTGDQNDLIDNVTEYMDGRF